MIVRNTSILLLPLLAAGCATQRPSLVVQPPSPVMIAATSPTKFVETVYDVRGYREPADSAIRHEAHAVYRRTRVPISRGDELATVPRESYSPASVAPLPASDELNVELSTQRKITAELRAMQASMVEAEQKMQAQYSLLVKQSADTLKVREKLEASRTRVRNEPQAQAVAPASTTPPGGNAEVKW